MLWYKAGGSAGSGAGDGAGIVLQITAAVKQYQQA